MAFKHGAHVSEQATAVSAVVEATAGLIVIVGTAPINLAKEPSVNEAKLVFNQGEAVKLFGFSNDFRHYTISEMTDSAFGLFGIAPVVMINVLDPEKHSIDGTTKVSVLKNKTKIEEEGILLESLEITAASGEVSNPLVNDTDYLVKFNSDGFVDITVLDDKYTELNCTYKKLDPTKVTPGDIIGGIDIESGASTGLELVNEVFPKYRLVPGTIIAPGFSDNPAVNAVLKTKAQNINKFFKAISLSDLDSKQIVDYSKVPEWKEKNNYTSAFDFDLWPEVTLAGKQYRMSTQVACLIASVDASNGDIPYVSPSNKSLQMTGTVLANGKEISLGPDQAEYLNSQGITTALNWIGGWKLWGNHTGCFPANTDVKDSFLANRRMHNFIGNTLILNSWSKVDNPTNDRQIDNVLDTFGIYLNGLEAANAIIGGRIEFLQADNPETSLLAGKTKFRVFLATPVPNEELEFVLEYDVNYLKTLFE